MLNDDVYLKILSYLPVRCLLFDIPYVNKQFNEFIKENSLWKLKCVNEGISTKVLGEQDKSCPNYYKRIYFNHKYGFNLLLNSCANEGFKHWTIKKDGGDKIKVEDTPCGADAYPDQLLQESGQKSVKNWVTSYNTSKKFQIIDLEDQGIDAFLLDQYKPDIIISEWHCGRFDCGNEYNLKVQLLDKKKSVIQEFKHHSIVPTGERNWQKVTKAIDCGLGVRFIKYSHSSMDIRYWAGHYGGKFTMCSVRLMFKYANFKTN